MTRSGEVVDTEKQQELPLITDAERVEIARAAIKRILSPYRAETSVEVQERWLQQRRMK